MTDIERIEKLFQQAADLPVAERAGFLEAAEVPPEVRAKVRDMLERFERDGSIDSPVRRDAGAEAPGKVVGRYKLLQEIGEGGFGVVYMAEQQEPVRRKVALKVLKLGMDTKDIVARFEAERQALALMDHPNIAKVLDGGTTDAGRPYFVMELVRGRSITDYCAESKLATRERLQLFVEVCHAVQHAHHKGIIHRDIKPSNVMVTLHDGRPVPKIIDFGVVKALHTPLTEKTLFTQYERFIGTPAYMSPEQAELSGLDVDTRTDIYALGAVLYELLTGTPPFDVQELLRSGLLEVQRVIREETPQRPSIRISTSGHATIEGRGEVDVTEISRGLRGELDWIVMKALEKERVRRYASASELAADIERHLDNQPVLARPPSRVYLLRKIMHRNRAAVVASVAVLIALVAGLLGIVFGLIQADRQRDEALAARREAETALDFLVGTLSLTDPVIAQDPNVSVRSLLDTASRGVASAFKDSPRAEARVRVMIGRAYKSLGDDEKAEAHLRVAIDLMEASGEYDPADLWQALWQLTHVCFNLGREDAHAISGRAMAAAAEHVARTDAELGRLLLEFYECFKQVPPVVADPGRALARAEAVLPADSPLWLNVAETVTSAAYSMWYSENELTSAQFWKIAMGIKERILGRDHPGVMQLATLRVTVLHRRGQLDRKLLDEAKRDLETALSRFREVFRNDHWSIGVAESLLGQNFALRGEFEQAEALLVAGRDKVLAVWEPDNYQALECTDRLIACYERWGKPARAAPLREARARTVASFKWVQPWSSCQVLYGEEHAELRGLLARLQALCGTIQYSMGAEQRTSPEIIELARKITALRRSTLPIETPLASVTVRLLIHWSDTLAASEHEAKRVIAEDAVPVLRHWKHMAEVAAAVTKIAESELESGKGRDAALAHAREAMSILRGIAPADLAWAAAVRLVQLGRLLTQLGRYDDAEEFLKRGHEILHAQLGNEGPARDATAELRKLYEAWGKPELAKRYSSH